MKASFETLQSMPPDVHGELLISMGPAISGIFAKTSHHLRNHVLLIKLRHAINDGQHETQLGILVDVYTNYSLIKRKADKSMIERWCYHLDMCRKAPHTTLLNALLATALLKILNNNDSRNLTREFNTLLSMQACISQQIANSVLAVLMEAEENEVIFNLCQDNHNILSELGSQAPTRSLNEMILLIRPFHTLYSKNNFLDFFFCKSDSLHFKHPRNFTYGLQAILNLIPDNHDFWRDANVSVRDLMTQFLMSDSDLKRIPDKAVGLLVTIQNRLENKCFLREYFNSVNKYFGKHDWLSVILWESTCNFISENELLNELESYYKNVLHLPNDSWDLVQRMIRHISKLKLEANIINALDQILLLLKSNQEQYIAFAIDGILSALPKIKSQEFILNYISEIFKFSSKTYKCIHQMSELSSICWLSKLSQKTISSLLEDFFTFYKNQIGSRLQNEMTIALCSRIKEQLFIEPLLGTIFSIISNPCQHPIKWFLNEKNFFYFECYLILSTKNPSVKTLKPLLDKLFFLKDNLELSGKCIALAAKLLPHIGSKYMYLKWIDALYERPGNFRVQYTTNWCLLANDNDMISREIEKIDFFLIRNPSLLTRYIDNIVPLLLKTPEVLSEKTSRKVFNEINYSTKIELLPSIERYFKPFFEPDHTVPMDTSYP